MGRCWRLGPVVALASLFASIGLPVVMSGAPVADAATADVRSAHVGTNVVRRRLAIVLSWSPAAVNHHVTSPSPSGTASLGARIPPGCTAPWTTVVSGRNALAKVLSSCARVPYVAHLAYTAGVPRGGGIGPMGKSSSSGSGAPTYYSAGQTYTDWYFPDQGYDSLQWTFQPVQDPAASLARQGLLHYYAFNFGLVHSSSDVGGGYAGLQTNGIFNGSPEGKVINFSIWGSSAAKSTSSLKTHNSECNCFQIMYKYRWVVGHRLSFELKQGPSGTGVRGTWWGLWVTDETTNVTRFVGEQRVANVINGQPALQWSNHTSVFGEDTHWWVTLDGIKKYTNCRAFESSSVVTLNVRANATVPSNAMSLFTNSGEIKTGGSGFQTVNCPVSIFFNNHHDVQHSLGYWPSPPPNQAPSYPPVPDSTPPTAPSGLNSFATTATQTSLAWWPATDDLAVSRYDIYRDNVKIASAVGYRIVYKDTNIQPDTTYTYFVVARDIARNSSEASGPIQVTTSSAP